MTTLRGLYAVTPDWNDSKHLLAVTEAILAGGCRIVQYRNKTASDCHRQEQAGALRALTRRFGALLIVNDSVDLALQVEADGVHLGGDDGDLDRARARLGPGKILGASCYNDLALAHQAQAAGVDYVAFGSFFPSQVKPDARRANLDLLRAARREIELPICAIGGIDLSNAKPLVEAGADLLAVISALYEADEPKAVAHEFVSLFALSPNPLPGGREGRSVAMRR